MTGRRTARPRLRRWALILGVGTTGVAAAVAANQILDDSGWSWPWIPAAVFCGVLGAWLAALATRTTPAGDPGPGDEPAERHQVLGTAATGVRPVPPAVVPAQLRRPLTGFAGRAAETGQLLEALAPESGTDLVLVTGAPGVGKTELVVQAGHQAGKRQWFPGGIVSCDLRGYEDRPKTAVEIMRLVLDALQVPVREDGDDDALVSTYRSTLAARRPMLVILDNAADHAQVEPLLAGASQHRVLVTSRRTIPSLGGRLVVLDVLAAADAVATLDLVLRTARPGDSRITDDPAAAGEVAAQCGRLPLALQIAGALLVDRPGTPVAELAKDLRDESGRLGLLDDHRRAVLPAFELSYRTLPAGQARLFRLIAVAPGQDIATAAAAALVDRSEAEVRAALDDLAAGHLVEQPAHGRWRLHDLLRLFARHHAEDHPEDGRQDALERLTAHCSTAAGEANAHLLAAEGAEVVSGFPTLAAALAWFDLERANLVAIVLDQDTPRSLELASSLVLYLSHRRYTEDLRPVCATGVRLARRFDPSAQALFVLHTGLLLRYERRFDEALAQYEEAEELFTAEGRSLWLVAGVNSVCAVLIETGQSGAAIEMCTSILDTLDGKDDSENLVGAALNNLGLALLMNGDVDEAAAALEKAVPLLRDHGPRSLGGIALNNLALVRLNSGQTAAAVESATRAVHVLDEVGDRGNLTMALCNLALAHLRAGAHDEVPPLLARAEELARQLGDDSRLGDVWMTRDLLAYGQKRYAESLYAAEQARARYAAADNVPSEGQAAYNQAFTLRELGRPEAAAAAFQDAARLLLEGHNPKAAADSLDELAAERQSLRQFGSTLTARLMAAALHFENGADDLEVRAYDRAAKVIGRVRETDLTGLATPPAGFGRAGVLWCELGLVLWRVDRHDEAIAAFEDEVRQSTATGDLRRVSGALGCLAGCLAAVGRADEAVRAGREALDVAVRSGDRAQEAAALTKLAVAEEAVSDPQAGVEPLLRALAILEEIGRADRVPRTTLVLGHTLYRAGRTDEAIAAWERAAQLARDGRMRRVEAEASLQCAAVQCDAEDFDGAIVHARRARHLLFHYVISEDHREEYRWSKMANQILYFSLKRRFFRRFARS
ncbi:tetratricopeptide repeat protein [Lentzea sp. NPDC060358]|uniref:tetratricopeptide repeat protein n=1 Tax=Lentzea sp. NPDC060358 TaxID=3347103 RepID=UPI003655A10F